MCGGARTAAAVAARAVFANTTRKTNRNAATFRPRASTNFNIRFYILLHLKRERARAWSSLAQTQTHPNTHTHQQTNTHIQQERDGRSVAPPQTGRRMRVPLIFIEDARRMIYICACINCRLCTRAHTHTHAAVRERRAGARLRALRVRVKLCSPCRTLAVCARARCSLNSNCRKCHINNLYVFV